MAESGFRETPKERLIELAKNNDERIQQNLTLNVNTPAEALEILYSSFRDRIRASVIRHRNCSEELMIKALKDLSPRVQNEISRRGSSRVIKEMIQNNSNIDLISLRIIVCRKNISYSCIIRLITKFSYARKIAQQLNDIHPVVKKYMYYTP